MSILIGLIFIFTLSLMAGFFAWKSGLRDKRIYILFLLSLFVHAGAALFIYLAEFPPFSGGRGDYGSYHKSAEAISYEIKKGNLLPSYELRGVDHYYPTIIGYVYYITAPSMVIGQLFNAWIAALATVLLYYIVFEASQSSKWAFGIGLGVNFYPSFLFYSSLLLKDVFVILFSLASALFMLRILKKFSWRLFFLFYFFLWALTHFRFYVGIVMLAAFILSWFFFSSEPIKKRSIFGLVMAVLLGFIPNFFGLGYWGTSVLKNYIKSDTIAYYQEIAYTGKDGDAKEIPQEQTEKPKGKHETPPKKNEATPISEDFVAEESARIPPKNAGFDSTTDIKVKFTSPRIFIISFFEALAFILLGPFPWQMKEARHYFALSETIPWTFLAIFISGGIIYLIKKRHAALFLALFSGGLFLILMIYISNFGITTRIRMPAFIALTVFIPFGYKLIREKLNIINLWRVHWFR